MMGRVSASAEMTPDLWRQLVGQHVEARRRALYRSRRAAAEGSGISEIVWRQIESGRRQLAPDVIRAPNPEADTKRAICRRLGWSDDSIDRLLNGQKPVEEAVPAPVAGTEAELQAQVDELRQRLDDALRAIDDTRDRLELVEGIVTGAGRASAEAPQQKAG